MVSEKLVVLLRLACGPLSLLLWVSVASAQASDDSAAPAEVPVEVVVRAQRSETERLQKSSDAVTVVDLRTDRKRTADLGEVLARIPGVSVRRTGSLGSDFRISMNGLYDDQIRTFVDGVPIDLLYAQSLANVPVNLVDHVEVYHGVVPVRLGADALGGAINLVRPASYETGAAASYQFGSFGTHRATLTGTYGDAISGLIANASAFLDRAENDYEVEVETPDELGRLHTATVPRFHDAYRSYGAALEGGVVQKPWAERLMLQGFFSGYAKELQHNTVMTLPYGEAHTSEHVRGALLQYRQALFERVGVNAVASYAYRESTFVDKTPWVYDWYGNRVDERRVPGEVSTPASDQTIGQHSAFGRLTLDAELAHGHVLTLNTSPQYATRSGEQRLRLDPSVPDPLSGDSDMFAVVTGLEYRFQAVPLPGAPQEPGARQPEDQRIENALFVKWYHYRSTAEELTREYTWQEHAAGGNWYGAGDGYRLVVLPWLTWKTSYEYAARLPTPDELFGDGALVQANPKLEPETSHNFNLGPYIELALPNRGGLTAFVNAFLRDTANQIVQLGNETHFETRNVSSARSLGIEGATQWTSPRRYVTLQASATYQDQRNESSEGPFAKYAGDRIPNRPWLFASWGANLRFTKLAQARDDLEPFYQGRYTHEFYRGWESIGFKQFKDVVPAQVSHDVGITYGFWFLEQSRLDVTLEAQNVTDAKLYDMFGVQRPGRAFYAKVSAEM